MCIIGLNKSIIQYENIIQQIFIHSFSKIINVCVCVRVLYNERGNVECENNNARSVKIINENRVGQRI